MQHRDCREADKHHIQHPIGTVHVAHAQILAPFICAQECDDAEVYNAAYRGKQNAHKCDRKQNHSRDNTFFHMDSPFCQSSSDGMAISYNCQYTPFVNILPEQKPFSRSYTRAGRERKLLRPSAFPCCRRSTAQAAQNHP